MRATYAFPKFAIIVAFALLNLSAEAAWEPIKFSEKDAANSIVRDNAFVLKNLPGVALTSVKVEVSDEDKRDGSYRIAGTANLVATEDLYVVATTGTKVVQLSTPKTITPWTVIVVAQVANSALPLKDGLVKFGDARGSRAAAPTELKLPMDKPNFTKEVGKPLSVMKVAVAKGKARYVVYGSAKYNHAKELLDRGSVEEATKYLNEADPLEGSPRVSK